MPHETCCWCDKPLPKDYIELEANIVRDGIEMDVPIAYFCSDECKKEYLEN